MCIYIYMIVQHTRCFLQRSLDIGNKSMSAPYIFVHGSTCDFFFLFFKSI